MRRLIFTFLLLVGICTLYFVTSQQAFAATLTPMHHKPNHHNSNPAQQSSSSTQQNSNPAQQNPSGVIDYKLLYAGNIEWIAILPQQLGSSQTFWICYPAALTYSNGTYNIAGQWEADQAANALVYVPYAALDSNQSFTGQQQVGFSSVNSWVPSFSIGSYPTYDPTIDAPAWSQPGYLDPESFSTSTG